MIPEQHSALGQRVHAVTGTACIMGMLLAVLVSLGANLYGKLDGRPEVGTVECDAAQRVYLKAHPNTGVDDMIDQCRS